MKVTPFIPFPKYSPQRWAAVTLVLLQAFALGFLMRAVVLWLSASIIALGSLEANRRRWLISLPGDRWILILGAVFFAKWYFAPYRLGYDYGFLFSEFAFELSSFCLVVQLCFLFRRQNTDRLPISFLGFAIVGMVFTGDIRLNAFRRTVNLVLVQLFLWAWMWFSLRSRQEASFRTHSSDWFRSGVLIAVLVISAGLGTTLSVLLHKHEKSLENAIAAYLAIGSSGTARSGFSNRGGLSDVSTWRNDQRFQLALRIESDRLPGYLRGKAFDQFSNDRWSVSHRAVTTLPEGKYEQLEEKTAFTHTYLLVDSLPDELDLTRVWPVDHQIATHCFTPLNTVAVSCKTRPVSIDQHGIVSRPNEQSVLSYVAVTSTHHVSSPPIDKENLLQIPEDLDPRVQQVAMQLFDLADSPRLKIEAVQQFFQDNFQYHLGIDVPEGEDKLGWFLQQQAPAHCEYFATASAILLRLGGVPTRYVTGYLVQEQSEINGDFIARHQDAHAWVEAWDAAQRQWVIVESTPSEGLPAPADIDVWQQRREAMAQFFRSIQDNARHGHYITLAWALLKPGLIILAGFTFLTVLGQLVVRITWANTKARKIDRPQTELMSERAAMDRHLEKCGIKRDDSETTTQFANRIAAEHRLAQAVEISNWYLKYTECRYRPGQLPDTIAQLRQLRLEATSD